MQHIAIMQKSWGLTEKIATGQKVIESRWYTVKYPPWGKIFPGEKVYFKNTGEPISIQVEVDHVLYFSDLTPGKVQEILDRYGNEIGIAEPQLPKFFEMFKHASWMNQVEIWLSILVRKLLKRGNIPLVSLV